MSSPVVLVLGAGPGLGTAVARRFGEEGYAVALVARDAARLEQLAETLQTDGITTGWAAVDLTDADALTAAVRRFHAHTGRVDVVVFNPSVFREADPLTLTAEQLLRDVALGTAALLTAVQALDPVLRPGGRIVATGSMAADRPWHRAASLGVQKAALRNLVRSLDATLAGRGVRAATLTVNGTLEPGTPFDPEHVAEALWQLTVREDEDWTSEVGFDG
jgi:NAD(P)-dependent dehydrogenase (short-subunit alcohol dehydrogenase family)